jgi:hypothetical protein
MESTFTEEIKSQLQTFILPDEFSIRLQELEIELYEGTLNYETLNELFEIYSVCNL